jgi:hypothetical protein
LQNIYQEKEKAMIWKIFCIIICSYISGFSATKYSGEYVRTPPSRNPFLACFMISRAYLNGLIDSVCLRIPVDNSSVLKEGLLGIKVICISLRVYFVL